MKTKQQAEQPTLEAQLKRLDEIAVLLDRGELPLDEQLKLYEEGMGLAQSCRSYLESAELKVEQLGTQSQDSNRG